MSGICASERRDTDERGRDCCAMLLRLSNGRSEDVSLLHCAHVPRVASVRYRPVACVAALRQASTRPAAVDRRGGGDGGVVGG